MNETDLLAKGFIQQPDGSWSKRPRAVGAVEGAERKPDQAPTLDRRTPIQKTSCSGLVVGIIGCQSRILDSDNFIAGAKPLRDEIAASFDIDDADPRLIWEYHQLRTTGPEGVIVCISTNTKT